MTAEQSSERGEVQDSTCWTAIQQGDIEYVVNRYWQPIYRFLRARLGQEDLAEEVTQINNFLHRARAAYAQAIRELIAQYTRPGEVEEEVRSLGRFLECHRLQGPPPSTFIMGE